MKKGNCFIILLLFLCGVFALVGWAINGVPTEAEATFGPASPTLSYSQKFFVSWRLLQNEDDLTSPANPFGAEIPFRINLGESPTSVANRLETDGLIRDGDVFRDYLIYAGLDTRIQAGDYALSPAAPAIDIAYNLLDATPTEVPFAILAGWRLEEVAESLPNSGLDISAESFLAEAQNRNLEGYLLPGIYTVPRTISLNALLDLLTFNL